MSRNFAQRLACACALALSAGFSSFALAQDAPGVTKDEIKLGAWTALTGPFAVYGVPGVAGQAAYYGLLNEQGGVNGRKITVITEDHAYNPQQAVAAARKLVDSDQVLAIQGSYATGPSAATFPYLDQQGVPYIMPYGGAVDWYEPVRPLVIGAQTLLDYQARALGRWAGKDGFKNVLVIHAAVAAYEKVASNVEPGLRSASSDAKLEMMPVKMGTTDYAPIALEVAGKKPDAIVFIGTIIELAALAKELKQQSVETQIFTYGGNVTADLINLGGDAVEGLRSVSLSYTIDSDQPTVQEYRDALAKFAPGEEPDYGSLLTYGLAKIAAEGIRLSDEPLTRESLVKGFEKLKDYESGILGKVTITADSHLGTTQVLRVEIKDGNWSQIGDFIDSLGDW